MHRRHLNTSIQRVIMTIPSDAELRELANESDPTTSPYYVSVLYGDYGNRKTTTACSMVNERGLLLSSDDSWKVLKNPRHTKIADKIEVKKLSGLSQFKYLDFTGYDTIIWDTFSQSVDEFLDLLYDEAKWGGNYREKIISKNEQLKSLEALGFVDYRVTRDTFRPVLNKLFKETESHIIFTAQMTEPVPGMGANQQKRPSVPQATFKIVGTRADIIANTKLVGNKAVADVTQSLTQLGKTRIEGIQGSMDLDTFVAKYKETVFK
jgi:hypothetical protein